MLIAIAAAYNLELKQYKITNAFIYAVINQEVYIRMPNSY
jgi:hypothetical protein